MRHSVISVVGVLIAVILAACGTSPTSSEVNNDKIPVGSPPQEFTPMPTAIVGQPETRIGENIYYVVASGCKSIPGREIRQTAFAFTINGVNGLLTALHGVNGCDRVGAGRDDVNGTIYQDLELDAVDIDRDVAFLRQSDKRLREGDEQPIPGTRLIGQAPTMFAKSCDLGTDRNSAIMVSGYPTRNKYKVTSSTGKVQCIRKLGDRISGRTLELELDDRNSPSPEINILDLQDFKALHGHSGAPVFARNETGSLVVVGIVIGRYVSVDDGSSKSGETNDNGWGIVLSELQLVSPSEVEDRLATLADRPILGNFVLEVFFVADTRFDDPPALLMKDGQVWNGNYSIQRVYTDADACLKVMDRPMELPGSAPLGVIALNAGDLFFERDIQVFSVPELLAGRTESYRDFCLKMSQPGRQIELYAYLVRRNDGTCLDSRVFAESKAVEDVFLVIAPQDASRVGFCAQPQYRP